MLIAVSSFGESLRRAHPHRSGGGGLKGMMRDFYRNERVIESLEALPKDWQDNKKNYPLTWTGVHPDTPPVVFNN